ncbi:MAG: hypothetical protein FWD60_01500 [Candidatus Azobacteroides sp.]|nr:hypothetical protein [Candidatus Azobacteroides sp.]
MKNLSLLSKIFIAGIILFNVNVIMSKAQTVSVYSPVFEEHFSGMTGAYYPTGSIGGAGTGTGNTQSAAGGTLVNTDNPGWTACYAQNAYHCPRLGVATGGLIGWLQTPAINLSGNCNLSFNAVAQNSTGDLRTINVIFNGDTENPEPITDLDNTSAANSYNFKSYSYDFTGDAGYQIRFTALNADYNRFLIADVVITQEQEGTPVSLPYSYNGNASNAPDCFVNFFSVGDVTIGSNDFFQFAATGSGQSIVLCFKDTAESLSFNLATNKAGYAGVFLVEESADGKNFTELTSYTSNTSGPKTISTISEDTRFIRWRYQKADGIVNLSNIVLNRTATGINEIQQETAKVYAQGQNIIIDTENTLADKAEIYNLQGQKISSCQLSIGENSIQVPSSQTYLVKVNNKAYKVFVK